MKNKTTQNDASVVAFIEKIGDIKIAEDAQALIALMQKISGHEPKMWGPGIVGFDTYHYKSRVSHLAPIC